MGIGSKFKAFQKKTDPFSAGLREATSGQPEAASAAEKPALENVEASNIQAEKRKKGERLEVRRRPGKKKGIQSTILAGGEVGFFDKLQNIQQRKTLLGK